MANGQNLVYIPGNIEYRNCDRCGWTRPVAPAPGSDARACPACHESVAYAAGGLEPLDAYIARRTAHTPPPPAPRSTDKNWMWALAAVAAAVLLGWLLFGGARGCTPTIPAVTPTVADAGTPPTAAPSPVPVQPTAPTVRSAQSSRFCLNPAWDPEDDESSKYLKGKEDGKRLKHFSYGCCAVQAKAKSGGNSSLEAANLNTCFEMYGSK